MRNHFAAHAEERGYIYSSVEYVQIASRWLFTARLPNGKLTEQCLQIDANEVRQFVEKVSPAEIPPTYAEMNESVNALLSRSHIQPRSLPDHYDAKRAVRIFVSKYVVKQFPIVYPPVYPKEQDCGAAPSLG
jgi:hypothetical protein